MVYRTKTGPGCSTLVVLTLILPVAGLACLVVGEAMVGLILLTTGLALVAAPLLLVVFLMGWPVEYDPGASGPDGEPILLVRCGRKLRYRIPLAEISEVRPSAELVSSPASWSYDRLKVVYPTVRGVPRSLLISPQNRDGFLDELARRATHLERDGDSLRRIDRPRPPEPRS